MKVRFAQIHILGGRGVHQLNMLLGIGVEGHCEYIGTAGAQYSEEFTMRRIAIPDVLHHVRGQGNVKGFIGKTQTLQILVEIIWPELRAPGLVRQITQSHIGLVTAQELADGAEVIGVEYADATQSVCRHFGYRIEPDSPARLEVLQ